jgi:hypothetical protein
MRADRVKIQKFVQEIIDDVIKKKRRYSPSAHRWFVNLPNHIQEDIHEELANKIEDWIDFCQARE